MNKEEYTSKRGLFKNQISVLHDKMNLLDDEYIASLPIKSGERVTVIVSTFGVFDRKIEQPIECFIGLIEVRYGGVQVNFNKVKKDGAMSGQSAGIYSFDRIEKQDGTVILRSEI